MHGENLRNIMETHARGPRGRCALISYGQVNSIYTLIRGYCSSVSSTKGVLIQIGAVSMSQKRARALRDLLARYCNPHLQRLKIKTQKSVCQNLIMGQSYGLRRIFLPAFPILDFPNMAIS